MWIDDNRIKRCEQYRHYAQAQLPTIDQIKHEMAMEMAREIVDKLWEFNKIALGETAGHLTFHSAISIIVPKTPSCD